MVAYNQFGMPQRGTGGSGAYSPTLGLGFGSGTPQTGGATQGGSRIQQGGSRIQQGGAPAPAPSPSAPGATPYGAAGESAGELADFGSGLLDPESDMSKRWMEELRENIGRSTDAGQRAAAYQAAQQGFGAGASPEMLEMEQTLGVAGQEAEGQAASDFMLKAPSMGVDALSRATGAQTGMRGQDLQGRMAEMSNYLSREQSNAGMEMQQRNLDLERERMEQDRYLRELMMEYGGY